MNSTRQLANRYLWKKLIINGLFDDYTVSSRKAVEKEMYNIVHASRARWRNAESPIYALRKLVREGVPLKFLKDNIGIIARSFSWEKSGSHAYYVSDSFDVSDEESMKNICFNNYDYLVKGISLETRNACPLHKGRHGQDCERIREVETTNDMGIVWTEVLEYYNYVESQRKTIERALKCT